MFFVETAIRISTLDHGKSRYIVDVHLVIIKGEEEKKHEKKAKKQVLSRKCVLL